MEKYIIQKNQKISSALYLVTDFIKDNDAIKWEIREEAVKLVSFSLMLGTETPIERDHYVKMIISTSNKILTFLNICLLSSLISNMNANVLIHEIDLILEFIKNKGLELHPTGYILSDTFFATDSLEKDTKGQDPSSRKDKDLTYKLSATKPIDKRIDNRKQQILSLLKKSSNLSIKDFSSVIKDCSEKTIQRELIILVKEGVVKRIGERRWSTYSLV